jgi:hypothetical protein
MDKIIVLSRYFRVLINNFISIYSRQQLISVCLDLWFAGLETSTATLKWAIVYMLNNDGVQQRIHAEIDQKIGADRPIEMADRLQLPYTCAVINVKIIFCNAIFIIFTLLLITYYNY